LPGCGKHSSLAGAAAAACSSGAALGKNKSVRAFEDAGVEKAAIRKNAANADRKWLDTESPRVMPGPHTSFGSNLGRNTT